jgi:hypothetical protein
LAAAPVRSLVGWLRALRRERIIVTIMMNWRSSY